jgi:hypothetical protein
MKKTMTVHVETLLPKTKEAKRVTLFYIIPETGLENNAIEVLNNHIDNYILTENISDAFNRFDERDNPFSQVIIEGIKI